MNRRSKSGLLGAAVAALLLIGVGSAPAAPPGSSFPERLGFQAGDDWEPSIAADRFGHVYAFWNHYTPTGGAPDPSCPECPSPHMELQVSSDGGRTWSQPRALLPNATVRQDDPQIVVDPVDGRTVYAGFMMGDKSSMFVAKSTDFGQSWKPVLVEDLQRGTDKDILAVRGDDVYLVYNAVMKIYASVFTTAARRGRCARSSPIRTRSSVGPFRAAGPSTPRATRTSPGPGTRGTGSPRAMSPSSCPGPPTAARRGPSTGWRSPGRRPRAARADGPTGGPRWGSRSTDGTACTSSTTRATRTSA